MTGIISDKKNQIIPQCCFLGCDTVLCGRRLITFWGKTAPSYSWSLLTKMRKQKVETSQMGTAVQ